MPDCEKSDLVAGYPSTIGSPPAVPIIRRATIELQAYPPDGEIKLWWDRLKKALGTVSSDFVNARYSSYSTPRTPVGAGRGIPMTCPTTLPAILEALRNVGATEEMIAAAVKADGESRIPHRAREAARKRGERAAQRPPDGRFSEPPRPPDAALSDLRGRLEEAGQGHFDSDADVAPIRALLDQGCDLETDILPIVAREVPELPHPLRTWGAQWLAREILAARDRRLACTTKAAAALAAGPPPSVKDFEGRGASS